MGLEPTTFGTTIRRSNQLSYIHRPAGAKVPPLYEFTKLPPRTRWPPLPFTRQIGRLYSRFPLPTLLIDAYTLHARQGEDIVHKLLYGHLLGDAH